MPIQEGGTFTPHDRIISPGVFTREFDQSGIAQGVQNIGAVIIAPFAKGPGFSPTLVRDQLTLETLFGVADGTLYGPYAAREYLLERGLVTVCRVGALTGYHQKNPFIIYAIKGEHRRNGDTGSLNSGSSTISFTGLTVGSSSAQFLLESSAVVFVPSGITVSGANILATGSLLFKGADANLVFVNGSGTATNKTDPSGSLYYYGQSVDVGTASGSTGTFQFSVASSSLSGSSATTASLTKYVIASSVLTSSISTMFFNGGSDPFDYTSTTPLYLFQGAISSSVGQCNVATTYIQGMLAGQFGAYNGQFTPSGSAGFDPCSITWSTASADYRILAVLADTMYGGLNTSLEAPGFLGSSLGSASVNTTEVGSDYVLSLKRTNGSLIGSYQFDLNPNSAQYIGNVFGREARVGDPNNLVAGQKIEAAYLYTVFPDTIGAVVADKVSWFISGSVLPDGNFQGEPLKFTDEFSLTPLEGDSAFALRNAYTPWIVSQEIAPWQTGSAATRYRLFKIHTLGDGTIANKSYKIEISNVKLAGTVPDYDWGTFTLTVRSWDDSDKKPIVIETFRNLDLNPSSKNYIARRIGDSYRYVDYNGKVLEFGDYPNQSKHIRVEMNTVSLPVNLVPYGFEAFTTPLGSSAGRWVPPLKYSKASIYSAAPGKYPSGMVFNDAPVGADAELTSLYPTSSAGIGVANDTVEYCAPLPDFGVYSTNSNGVAFAMDMVLTNNGVGFGDYIPAELSGAVPAEYDAARESTYVKMRKFVLGFQGGFDGQSPAIPLNIGGDITADNTQGLNCAGMTTAGSVAYKQCINAVGNADEFDVNLVVAPGIVHEYHSYITNALVDMCEARGDCMAIIDLYVDDGNPTSGQIDTVVEYASEFDTNYAAAYYPWVKILDPNINQVIAMPPSALMPAVYAGSDKIAAPWFAPAGLNRGGINNAVGVTDRTTHTERDTLYENKVNPIAVFPGEGVAVWGQKTLQNAESALDRVNVRRLMIDLKKFFASTSKYLLFEQNTSATRNKFLAITNPYMETVKQRSGLYNFFVKMDEDTNTADIIDSNMLYGKIYVQPTKAVEFIVLDFTITPTGAVFPTT